MTNQSQHISFLSYNDILCTPCQLTGVHHMMKLIAHPTLGPSLERQHKLYLMVALLC